jgi:hypothetical protein
MKLRPLTIFIDLKKRAAQRVDQNLKCILCRITFYFEKIFIDEPSFQWKRQKGLAGTWLKLAFPFYLLFIVCVGDFTLVAGPEAGVLVRKLSQLTPLAAKLSRLTPDISYCSVGSAVS